MITLQGLCSNLSRMQDAVSRWNFALQGARNRANNARESWATTRSRTADASRRAAQVAEMQAGADEALEEYRDAVPKAAFVLTTMFDAANDPHISRSDDLCKLLAHGALTYSEMLVTTGWSAAEAERACSDTRIGCVTVWKDGRTDVLVYLEGHCPLKADL